MRNFLNKLKDYDGQQQDVDPKYLKTVAKAVMNTVAENIKISDENIDGGLYVGLAGISYMLYHISKSAAFSNERMNLLDSAMKFINLPASLALYGKSHALDKVSFLTGDLGTLAAAAIISQKLGNDYHMYIDKYKEAFHTFKEINWFKKGGDELFVGRSGYLCGILWMQKELNTEIQKPTEIYYLLDTIVESGRIYSRSLGSSFPLMYHYYNTQYLGQAHGLSGILTILLSFPEWLESNKAAAILVRQTVDILLQLQTSSGNFPCAVDEINRPPEHELVHWCHGAPGTIYMLAKAFQVFKDEKYLISALRCGELTWQRGLLYKGPGICHGVSGSGYVFLVLYQLTKDPKHLHRANQLMKFMESEEFHKARVPDSPYSLFEGLAGKACFVADLIDPLKGGFPLFNIW